MQPYYHHLEDSSIKFDVSLDLTEIKFLHFCLFEKLEAQKEEGFIGVVTQELLKKLDMIIKNIEAENYKRYGKEEELKETKLATTATLLIGTWKCKSNKRFFYSKDEEVGSPSPINDDLRAAFLFDGNLFQNVTDFDILPFDNDKFPYSLMEKDDKIFLDIEIGSKEMGETFTREIVSITANRMVFNDQTEYFSGGKEVCIVEWIKEH